MENPREGSVIEGKKRLSYAIQKENAQEIRDALVYLSTTSLAWSANNGESRNGGSIEKESEKRELRINIDFDVRLPPHHEYGNLLEFGPALHACI